MRAQTQTGVSLIELLVAMAIGLVVTLAASTVLLSFEGNKRKMTTLNDLNQAGAFVSYLLDRNLRNAGSGFAQKGSDGYGCVINASRDGSAVLPAPLAFPAPFSGINPTVRLAPALIYDGASESGSDVLAIMAGTQGFSELPSLVLNGSIDADSVNLINTLGWRPDDIAMVFQVGGGCLIQQVGNVGVGQELPFSGAYRATGLNAFGGGGVSVYVASLGNVTQSRPVFQLMGVGDNNRLLSHDLLRFNGIDEAPQVVLDGVLEMQAVYGLDTDRDGDIDSWVRPTGAWSAASLLDGSPAASGRLQLIAALRVGMILQTTYQEKEAVESESVTLFEAVGLPYERTFTNEERRYRHKTVEFAVPLRNVLITNQFRSR
jgi:type IV pilus assembly protein PilW